MREVTRWNISSAVTTRFSSRMRSMACSRMRAASRARRRSRLRRTWFSTRASSSSRRNGLVRKSTAPSRRALTGRAPSLVAVMSTTGMSTQRGSIRRAAQHLQPAHLGHHHVQQQQVGKRVRRFQQVQHGTAAHGGAHVVAGYLQRTVKALQDGRDCRLRRRRWRGCRSFRCGVEARRSGRMNTARRGPSRVAAGTCRSDANGPDFHPRNGPRRSSGAVARGRRGCGRYSCAGQGPDHVRFISHVQSPPAFDTGSTRPHVAVAPRSCTSCVPPARSGPFPAPPGRAGPPFNTRHPSDHNRCPPSAR